MKYVAVAALSLFLLGQSPIEPQRRLMLPCDTSWSESECRLWRGIQEQINNSNKLTFEAIRNISGSDSIFSGSYKVKAGRIGSGHSADTVVVRDQSGNVVHFGSDTSWIATIAPTATTVWANDVAVVGTSSGSNSKLLSDSSFVFYYYLTGGGGDNRNYFWMAMIRHSWQGSP